MATGQQLLARIDWARRAPEFRRLYGHDDDAVVVDFEPTACADTPEWEQLRALWADLPSHPNLLAPLGLASERAIRLEYAALDWELRSIELVRDTEARRRFGRWGAALADLFAMVLANTPRSSWRLWLRPFVRIDVGGAIRVGFLPPVEACLEFLVDQPPELFHRDAEPDEASFVFVIGKLLSRLGNDLDGPAAQVRERLFVGRCLAKAPAGRYPSLRKLHAACALEAKDPRRRPQSAWAWETCERALGLLALNPMARVRGFFADALAADPELEVAREMLLHLERPPPPPPGPRRTWAQDSVHAKALETARDFAAARDLYFAMTHDGLPDIELDTAIARCQLALGCHALAVEAAERALAKQPTHAEALGLRARAELAARRSADALRSAEAWVAAHPGDGAGHYVRGRALFDLARFVEAHDAFDRACTLVPQMTEALLLRRETARALKRLGRTVGRQPALELPVPAHLPEIREAIAAGDVERAIGLLYRPRHADDGPARLLHGRCLVFVKRYPEALAELERAIELAPATAVDAAADQANALVELGRADEALARCEAALATRPTDLAVLDARAMALRALGRERDANADLERVIAASDARADLRAGRLPR